MKALIKTALRQQALYLPVAENIRETDETIKASFELLNNIFKLGYTVSEPASKALHKTSAAYKYLLYEALADIKGVNNNKLKRALKILFIIGKFKLIKGKCWDIICIKLRLENFKKKTNLTI